MKAVWWIAAQVRSNSELSVSSALRGKGYETFVPTYARVRDWSDRKKVTEAALIAGYVFVQVPLEKAHGPVVTTPGVIKIVEFGGKVAQLDEGEIERVRRVAHSSLRPEPWSYIKQNSQVKIARGALAGIRGTVLKVQENMILIVSIEMLQRSIAVHIDRSWVEPARD